MNKRELLELAARAAGYTLKWGEVFIVGDDEVDCTDITYVVSGQHDEADWHWDPLTDDGDALRLAVKLEIDVVHAHGTRTAVAENTSGYVAEGSDPYAATRRAIVRAAAEIGKGMK